MNYKDIALEYIANKGISNSSFAKKVGISESSFSRYINGNYPNPTPIDDKIKEFIEKENLRKDGFIKESIDFALTSISKKVISVLEYARVQKVIACIYGDAGIGKTYTTKHWIEDKKDVFFVTVNPAFSTPKPFLKLLAKCMKSKISGGQDDIYLGIMEKLEGTDKMIVIDEAQHLTKKSLEIIRGINDYCNTAIVLIGNELIYNKMLGRAQAEFAQLFSRVGMRSHLLTDIFDKNDIELVFNGADDKVVEILLDIARSKFGLRGATLVYTNALNNGNLSLDGIKAMAEVMGISLHIA